MDGSLYQAPLSMEFSRQGYWSGLLFPSPGDLPDPGIEPRSPALQADSLPYEPLGNAQLNLIECLKNYGRRFMTLLEAGIRTIPKKKKCKKAKWLSEEALQIDVKRRDMKSKGEKERYSHLNAEFQRIARRVKKAFLSDQCKEIEENNRMGKIRDLSRKLEIPREHFMQRSV